ncbi:pantoate--beta-alanine ligase [Rothia sp. LK2588]|uniref:pantoate--beta-alanine ligase n=1 Tax=Rothia sp. LK2588 TaxID=3114369 RepID=UPI00390816CF
MTTSPHIVTSVDELQKKVRKALKQAQVQLNAQATDDARPRHSTLGFVPTMGALHDGHAQLIRRAREQNDVVVVSVFINPLQFGPGEDFDRYPRTLEADAALAGEADVDFIFAPTVEEMYPDGEPAVRVSAGEMGTFFEGATRPGHFDGVLTVVNKFFNILKPAAGRHLVNAYFGQKDAQQLALVQRMVADFNHSVTIKSVSMVREDNGLAYSSRNQYLSDEQREQALVLSRTLALLREQMIAKGPENFDLSAARERIDSAEGVRLDYLEMVDPTTFKAPTADSTRVLGLVAAYVGETRLIDNMELL